MPKFNLVIRRISTEVTFEFETPKFRSQKFGSQILIEFNSPISSKFDKGKRDLGKYIKTLLTQDEGREAVVTMQGKLEYKVYRVANKIILDVGPEVESASKGLEGRKTGKLRTKSQLNRQCRLELENIKTMNALFLNGLNK